MRAAVTRRPEMTPTWRVFSVPAFPIVSTWMKLRIRDGEKLPHAGAFILAPNHYSDFDPIVMGLAMWRLGRVPRFLAKASLFRIPVFGRLVMRGLGHVPVERGASRTSDPLAGAGDLIARGQGVIMYPEGTLTRDPDLWPMRGKTGAVRAALAHGIPIVPAAHWGVQHIMPRWSKRLRLFPRKPVDVIIGDPLDLSPWEGRPVDARVAAEATAALMAAITALVEQLRGEAAPVERWDPAAHGQSEHGRP